MKILLTNDDGIIDGGLWALAHALKVRAHDVTIAAPFKQQSGTSHILSLTKIFEQGDFMR